jgi:hypothetical protein
VVRRCRVVPFRVDDGKLYVAGPEYPTDDTLDDLRSFTSLKIEFHYITPQNYARLSRELLGVGRTPWSARVPLDPLRPPELTNYARRRPHK